VMVWDASGRENRTKVPSRVLRTFKEYDLALKVTRAAAFVCSRTSKSYGLQ